MFARQRQASLQKALPNLESAVPWRGRLACAQNAIRVEELPYPLFYTMRIRHV